jgi:hypothetical protein
MSPVHEVGLVLQRELSRNLRSAKGILLGLMCLLGSIGFTVLAVGAQDYEKKTLHGEEATLVREQFIAAMYDKDVAKAFAAAPTTLFGIMLATVSLSWVLSALVGFDAVSSELQHRSVRYWTVRSRRVSFFLGKALGVFTVVTLLTLVIHVTSWFVVVGRGGAPLGSTLGFGARLWLATVPIAFAWCSLTTFVSALFRTPMLALLLTCTTAFGCWILSAIGRVSELHWLVWAHPGSYDRLLLSPTQWPLGVLAALGWGGALLTAGSMLFDRRDA